MLLRTLRALVVATALSPSLVFALDDVPPGTGGASGPPLPAASAPSQSGVPTPTPTPGGRPRICLVLSGGGARGAAHIGVLKVLESLRVPIDCIAGTSMGSLVGAAYATGIEPDEMEKIVGGLSASALFRERPPRQNLSSRRKEEDRSNLVTPEIGVKGGELLLPKGAFTGVQLEKVLRELAGAPGYRNFDKLPIPYRAVATDLVTGTAVVFSEGELVRAMRASMSVPGVIAPVEYEGKMLVDGGLVNNLPVDVAHAMGADIIIAVNLGTSLMPRESLKSALSVTMQMLNILTEQNVRKALAMLGPNDILIEPELGDFSAGDFDHLSKTIPIGEAAAQKVEARLAALSLPPEQYAMLRKRQLMLPPADSRPVDEVRIAPMERVNREFITSSIQTKPGEPLNEQRLDDDLSRIFGTGDFEHVDYRILEEPGKRVLSVDAIEKSYGPNYVRFGLGLSTDFRGDTYFNLLASYRRTWLNSYGAEWRTDVQVGQTSRLTSELYQPVNANQSLFVAPRIELERRRQNVFQDTSRIATYDFRRYDFGFDVGTQFTKYGELRAGVVFGHQNIALSTGPQFLVPPVTSVQRGAFTSRFLIDQLDSAIFPREGYAGGVNIYASRPELGADQTYTKAEGSGTYAWSSGRHTLNLGFRAGTNIGGDPLPNYDLFQWGGFLQQSGYSTGQLLGQNLQFVRAVYYNKVARQSLLEGVYGGFSLELGRMGGPLVPGNPTGWLKSGSVFVAIDSPIGPLYVAYGRAAAGHYGFYLFLGKP
ncbi:patatin-like phospholipase family protein [Cupriavidus lacunae]|uniref:Esterase n=1 Tax=Cupriavidus lacunae TaxID=2666307 RepID=A0A370NQ39_9BURK|nr:patatin-like phospholipase family protein [Cupriavidus lacunae]RDK07658.1 esterase [Cupriavidus lacunae]